MLFHVPLLPFAISPLSLFPLSSIAIFPFRHFARSLFHLPLVPCTLPAMFYGECLALTSAVLWGTIPILVRKGLPHSNASVAVVLGLLASVPLLLAVFVFHPRWVTQAITPYAAFWFAACGITGPCLGRLFNYLGVARLGAARATPLINASPLFTTIWALFFLREQITLSVVLGVLSIVAGIAVLAGQKRG